MTQSQTDITFKVSPASTTEKTVITWADINAAYKGWFHVPVAAGTAVNDEFGYSTGIHAQLSSGNLLMMGHIYNQKVMELKPPTTLNGSAATTVGSWKNICGNFKPANVVNSWQTGGMMKDGSLIRFTQNEFYNGAGTDYASQGYWDGTTAKGLWKTSYHSSYVAGYMSPAPDSIKSQNYTYLAGENGTSGAATSRWGPNLFAIRSTPGSTHPAAPLVHHPDEARKYPNWWIADKIHSMLWVDTPTKHGVLAFGYRGLSGFGYKQNNDPYLGGGGYTATSYECFLWIYNPADCLAVLAGTKQAWKLEPVEKKRLIFGDGNETLSAMFTGDPTNAFECSISDSKRMIVSVAESYKASDYSWTPRCYVFQF